MGAGPKALRGVDPLARERGARRVGEEIAQVWVNVDGKEIDQVLAKLLVNALRRTSADGIVASRRP